MGKCMISLNDVDKKRLKALIELYGCTATIERQDNQTMVGYNTKKYQLPCNWFTCIPNGEKYTLEALDNMWTIKDVTPVCPYEVGDIVIVRGDPYKFTTNIDGAEAKISAINEKDASYLPGRYWLNVQLTKPHNGYPANNPDDPEDYWCITETDVIKIVKKAEQKPVYDFKVGDKVRLLDTVIEVGVHPKYVGDIGEIIEIEYGDRPEFEDVYVVRTAHKDCYVFGKHIERVDKYFKYNIGDRVLIKGNPEIATTNLDGKVGTIVDRRITSDSNMPYYAVKINEWNICPWLILETDIVRKADE